MKVVFIVETAPANVPKLHSSAFVCALGLLRIGWNSDEPAHTLSPATFGADIESGNPGGWLGVPILISRKVGDPPCNLADQLNRRIDLHRCRRRWTRIRYSRHGCAQISGLPPHLNHAATVCLSLRTSWTNSHSVVISSRVWAAVMQIRSDAASRATVGKKVADV